MILSDSKEKIDSGAYKLGEKASRDGKPRADNRSVMINPKSDQVHDCSGFKQTSLWPMFCVILLVFMVIILFRL